MKLGCSLPLAAAAVVTMATGCASSAPKAPAASVPVSTTHVTAAGWDDASDDAPRVGKPQRGNAERVREDADAVGAPKPNEPRREDRRRGGFSGWK